MSSIDHFCCRRHEKTAPRAGPKPPADAVFFIRTLDQLPEAILSWKAQ